MGDRSKIEWTDASWNPIRARRQIVVDNDVELRIGWHCTHASEGCRFCYAETFNRRLGTGLDYKPGHEKDIEIFLDQDMLRMPLRWKRPRKIFVGSMTDIGASFVTDDMLDHVFSVAALCQRHTFIILSKRPERMRDYIRRVISLDRAIGKCARAVVESDGVREIEAYNISDAARELANAGPLPNVWIGTSCEDQETADMRIPHIVATPAAKRFLSCEPMLAPIDLRFIRWNSYSAGFGHPGGKSPIDWVICGGESGPHARPMHPDWARALRDQCAAAGVPFFFKQWGEWAPHPEIMDAGGSLFHRFDDGTFMQRDGKSRTGHMLDSVEHHAFPEALA